MFDVKSWLRRWLLKSVAINRVTTVVGIGSATYSPADYRSYATEGYSKNAYVASCIRKHADNLANLPWGVYRKRYGDRRQLGSDNELYRLLFSPNHAQCLRMLLRDAVSYWDIDGQCYFHYVATETTQRITEIWALRPDRVTVKPGATLGEVKLYEYEPGDNVDKVSYEPDTVLHIKGFNPLDDWYGMSTLKPGARSIDTHNQSKDWGMALLQNSGRPSGALVSDESLDDEQYERLRADMQREDIGVKNAGRAMLLDGGLKWVPMAFKPVDMDWLEGTNLSARELSIVCRTPPDILFDSKNKVFANYREARKAYYEECIMLDANYMRDELNRWLGPYFDDKYELDYNRDEIEALQEDRAALWESVGAAWWLTIDEKRRTLGLPDLEGGNGNVLMLPASHVAVTPDKLGEMSNRLLESVGQAVQGEIGANAPQNNETKPLDKSKEESDTTE